MSAKSYIITLSLTGTSAALVWAFLLPGMVDSSPAGGTRSQVKQVQTATSGKRLAGPAASAAELPAATGKAPAARIAGSVASSAASVRPLSPAERAAKVEQEANHDLRRLVELLNLDEAQQDHVFQALAKNSRHWTPEMQTTAVASPAGKRSPIASTPVTGDTAKTAPVESTPAKTDPLDEIMAALTPEQQEELMNDELDREAWWAEILPQILPDETVPAIDATGDVQKYEGSDVLE